MLAGSVRGWLSVWLAEKEADWLAGWLSGRHAEEEEEKEEEADCGPLRLGSLADVRQILEHAPKVYNATQAWVSIQLCELSCRSNWNADNHRLWCSIQVDGMIVDGTQYDLSSMDAHITIGTWFCMPNDCGPSLLFDEMIGRWIKSLLGESRGRGIPIGL